MTDNKTRPTEISVAGFIGAITDESKRSDVTAIMALMQSATGEPAKMWGPSIIGFGTYHYVYESGREGDMPLACLSPRKAATVVYGMGWADGGELLATLGKHTLSGGCLHIRKLSDVDQKVLEALIVNSVTAKRAQHPQ